MKVLVTGGSGLLGSKLVAAAKYSHDLILTMAPGAYIKMSGDTPEHVGREINYDSERFTHAYTGLG